MSEDTLAQEEIDALLNAAGEGGATLEEDKKESAGEIADEFLNSSKEIFLSLLGNDVSIEKEEASTIPVDMLLQEINEPVALVYIEADKGIKTSAMLLFDEKKMTTVTDLILMGEGAEKDKFSDDDKDALQEAVNQTMGNLGQNLTAKYKETVSFEQADVQLLPPDDAKAAIKEKISDDSFYHALYSLKVENKVETQLRLILPLSIEDDLKELDKKLNKKQADAVKVDETAYKSATVSKDAATDVKNLDLILDLNVEIIVKLGEALLPLRDITSIKEGFILSLDKASDDAVDVIVNNKIIAKGELVVTPPCNFAIRIVDIKNRMDRIKNLKFH